MSVESDTTATQTTAGDSATGKCIPTGTSVLYIPNPTAILIADELRDDTFKSVELPFPVGVFGSERMTVFVSENGILTTGAGTTEGDNQKLPSDLIPEISILPYWDDLVIYEDSGQGVWYSVFTSNRGRQATFEWIVGGTDCLDADYYRHFSATFYEDHLGVVYCSYYSTPDAGGSTTVGLQREIDLFGGRFYDSVQHSFNEPGAVPDGTYVLMDSMTGTGTITTGRIYVEPQC